MDAQTWLSYLPAWLTASVIILGACLVGFLLFQGYSWYQRRFSGRAGYTRKTFLTANEVDFYRRLRSAAEPRWAVFPQVAMGALMNTRLTPEDPHYWEARSAFAAKICDFVLCDPKTLEPQLIVELDDTMHDFKRDHERDSMTGLAGYRTVRFWSKKKPSVAELRQELERLGRPA